MKRRLLRSLAGHTFILLKGTASPLSPDGAAADNAPAAGAGAAPGGGATGATDGDLPPQCKFFANVCKFLAGSFSAVSKRNFARKYAFDSIFQDLQDLRTFAPLRIFWVAFVVVLLSGIPTFAPLQSQNFRK